jgi:hypothetical protein
MALRPESIDNDQDIGKAIAMRLCRYDENKLGVVIGTEVADVSAALESLPAARYPLPRHDPLYGHTRGRRSDQRRGLDGGTHRRHWRNVRRCSFGRPT